MSTSINKHGLARPIPNPVQRIIRQDCFNGCVICGRMPYQYEHFDPPFEEATEHKPEGMALLCPTHHMDRTAGRLSVEAVRRARKNPFNTGRAAVWAHHLSEDLLMLDIAGNILQGAKVGLSINGAVVFGLSAPATTDGQWLLTGSLTDPSGKETLLFRDNEVLAVNGSWDVSMEGSTLTVRQGPGQIIAQVSFHPEDQTIKLDRLDMCLGNGHALHADRVGLRVKGPAVNIQMERNTVINAIGSAFCIGNDGVPPKDFATLAIQINELGKPHEWKR